MSIAENVARVRQQLRQAAESSGRSSDAVRLVAVSKQHSLAAIQAAAEAGVTDFGENRLEEATSKLAAPQAAALRWHMIGHVQSRKARDVVAAGFSLVHSLDSVRLAERYSRFAQEGAQSLAVLLEINVSGEATKSGWLAYNWENEKDQRQTLWMAVQQMAQLPGLRLLGLMTMAPWGTDPEQTRPVFRRLRLLRDALQHDFTALELDVLSMGMTDDYMVAIQEGATLIRVGRAIFGERTLQ
ncbi:MAG: YggS family pyridoxal phosphate-dependent enzyme [Anaerolineae bacterium]|nr:YggS family pyridoxal phosphate-dependent enzyme [Anaerolineae bacterium]